METVQIYRRIKLLGEGSFGKAYLVECVSDGSKCVIKQMNLNSMTEDEKRETYKEARILEALRHPNIIHFREVYKTTKGKLCIVMDFADGGDLAKKISDLRGSYFQEQQIIDWFTQICLALKHVHDRKIIHRDLKCQNIFLTKDNTVKLGDFGIARVLKHTREKAKTMVGTPYYLSPEIIENHPYSFKSDVWSLGIVLYELCALKPPFNGDSLHSLALKIVRGNYSPIPAFYSRELKTFLGSLLTVVPDKRPSVNEILKKNLITTRIRNFLSESLRRYEFSHTILHKKICVNLRVDNIPETNDELAPPRKRAISREAPTYNVIQKTPSSNIRQINFGYNAVDYAPSYNNQGSILTPVVRRVNSGLPKEPNFSALKDNVSVTQSQEGRIRAVPTPKAEFVPKNERDVILQDLYQGLSKEKELYEKRKQGRQPGAVAQDYGFFKPTNIPDKIDQQKLIQNVVSKVNNVVRSRENVRMVRRDSRDEGHVLNSAPSEILHNKPDYNQRYEIETEIDENNRNKYGKQRKELEEINIIANLQRKEITRQVTETPKSTRESQQPSSEKLFPSEKNVKKKDRDDKRRLMKEDIEKRRQISKSPLEEFKIEWMGEPILPEEKNEREIGEMLLQMQKIVEGESEEEDENTELIEIEDLKEKSDCSSNSSLDDSRIEKEAAETNFKENIENAIKLIIEDEVEVNSMLSFVRSNIKLGNIEMLIEREDYFVRNTSNKFPRVAGLIAMLIQTEFEE